MKPTITLVMSLFLNISLATGCNHFEKDSNDAKKKKANTGDQSDPDLANDDTPSDATSCDKLWILKVKASPKGQLTEYRITQEIGGSSGSSTMVSEILTEEIIVASSDSEIKTNQTTTIVSSVSNGEKSKTETLTKSEFLQGCKMVNPNLPEGVSAESDIIEQREESITVEAGTFNTQYTKANTKTTYQGQQSDGLVEVWSTGDKPFRLTVKSIVETTRTIEGNTITQKMIRELTKFKEGGN